MKMCDAVEEISHNRTSVSLETDLKTSTLGCKQSIGLGPTFLLTIRSLAVGACRMISMIKLQVQNP